MKTWTSRLAAVAFLALAASAMAAEVAGVKLDDKAQVGNSDLVLNGAGVRTKVFFKVYVGALYLPAKTADAKAAIAAPGSKRVMLRMLRDIDAESLASALNEGLEKNLAPAELKALEPKVKELTAILTRDKEIKEATVIFLDGIPGQGTRVTANGSERGVVAGDELFPALLRVWLGDKPADEDLKKGMLGG
ncbi:MAG: chalcone isomerase family protein [Pseudomonadota bacterium]